MKQKGSLTTCLISAKLENSRAICSRQVTCLLAPRSWLSYLCFLSLNKDVTKVKRVRERHVNICKKCILNIEKRQGLNYLENSLDSSMASVEFRQRKGNRLEVWLFLGGRSHKHFTFTLREIGNQWRILSSNNTSCPVSSGYCVEIVEKKKNWSGKYSPYIFAMMVVRDYCSFNQVKCWRSYILIKCWYISSWATIIFCWLDMVYKNRMPSRILAWIARRVKLPLIRRQEILWRQLWTC